MSKLLKITFLLLLLAIDWAFDTDQGTNVLNRSMASQMAVHHSTPDDTGSSDYEGALPAFFLAAFALALLTPFLATIFEYFRPRLHARAGVSHLLVCLRQ